MRALEHLIKRSRFPAFATAVIAPMHNADRRVDCSISCLVIPNICKCGKSILPFFSTLLSITALTTLMRYFLMHSHRRVLRAYLYPPGLCFSILVEVLPSIFSRCEKLFAHSRSHRLRPRSRETPIESWGIDHAVFRKAITRRNMIGRQKSIVY